MPELITGMAFSWESQECQYAAFGDAGSSYEQMIIKDGAGSAIVDCLLYRNEEGRLVGILNHYPHDNSWEKKGNINLWVKPECRRQGIGSSLFLEAMSRWDDIEIEKQCVTPEGLALLFRLVVQDNPVRKTLLTSA